VDRDGVRIAVSAKSAYDLFLSRSLQHAQIVRAPSNPASIDLFTSDKLEAVAGVRQALVTAAAKIPGSRVMDGRFMVIPQAAGVPKGRDAGAKYLREFIEDAKASGFVAESLKKSGVDGATIAPPAP
jgi:polar amino acid transport system substrate-binding protein